ncbi:zonular occludens toxin domain-containing protein [Cupriavidus metallidurans]|uniref:zonular occludens toxin domain-containing protein n=1 Tax=Cupriavidus metallidurans TaxID=119219 RepID=UPI00068E1035|nr:zonular occludens toxin domain-containing protein [Cupriavidus metallidurans]
MLTLITGQPGNGKSLYTIAFVEEKRKLESRPVFYHGITDLTLPWTQLEDPTKWHECPEKSIIVIDEVQQVMPPRPSSQKPPMHVAQLETHRHRGFDLYFMTQDPSLVDNHIKKLAGEYVHLIRQWGREKADVFKMQKVQDPTNANLKRALRTTFAYPKEVYTWYKSADSHTHKKKIPFKYWLMFIFPVVAVISAAVGIRVLWKISHPTDAEPTRVEQKGPEGRQVGSQSIQAQQQGPMTAEQYVAAYSPRIAGLDYTAPVYDELTKPKRVPVPAACVTIRGGCNCYTQQGTRLSVGKQQCAQIVQTGFFMAFDPDGDAPKPVQQQAAPVAAVAPEPVTAPVVSAPVQLPVQVVPVAMTGGPKNRQLTPIDLAAFPEDDQDRYRARRPFER